MTAAGRPALQAPGQSANPERATLLAVMEGMSGGLLILDARRRPQYANARAGQLFGVDLAPLLGMAEATLLRRIRPLLADPRSGLASWRRARAVSSGSAAFELLVVGPPPRTLLVEMFQVTNGGGQRHFGVLLRDVSDERDLAREKNELLGAVSHELRTPLAALVGFAELMLQRDYTEPQRREFLTTMLREGWRLTRLINNFLDLQGLENGADHMMLTPTPLAPVVARAVRAVGADAASPIIVDLPDDLPLVLADAARIEDVLVNLLSNARKYSPTGGDIRVALQREDGHLQVAVSDHGQGIPADALPRLFEKFYRVDNSDGRTTMGAGLGLAVVRSTVEAHGGQVRAESAGAQQGSMFAFTLPVAKAPAAPPPSGADILVVEEQS